ncbi:hypothetical protein JCM8547_001593 [Rhodosporidiobolus lusitaniae]
MADLPKPVPIWDFSRHVALAAEGTKRNMIPKCTALLYDVYPEDGPRIVCQSIHNAFDHFQLDFLPTLGAVSARVACEWLYYTKNRASSSRDSPPAQKKPAVSPPRPDWQLFYERLEADPTYLQPRADFTFPAEFVVRSCQLPIPDSVTYRLVRTDLEDAIPDPPLKPRIPLLRVPVSTNLAILAARRRVIQHAPAPKDLQEDSKILSDAINLLLRFWRLSDTPGMDLTNLLEEAKLFLSSLPRHPFADILSDPSSASYDQITISPPSPQHYIDSYGTFAREGARRTGEMSQEARLEEAEEAEEGQEADSESESSRGSDHRIEPVTPSPERGEERQEQLDSKQRQRDDVCGRVESWRESSAR